jgi:DNA polymerase III alpha subunit
MQEILAYARQAGVPVSSRGSAASSLVAHCLGLTSPDPMRLNLYFERFLNPARATPPDIDTDLCSRRRDGVIQHVFEAYGRDRVAMVCTINHFRERSALREVAKAYGLSPAEVKTLTEALPYRGWGPPAQENASPYAELAAGYTTPLHQQVFRDAAALLGSPNHLSIHPGGVVIAPGPITDLVPVQLSSKGVVITQFDLDFVARLGLIKIDLLGIRGLTVLGDVADAVRAGRLILQQVLLDSAQKLLYKRGLMTHTCARRRDRRWPSPSKTSRARLGSLIPPCPAPCGTMPPFRPERLSASSALRPRWATCRAPLRAA